jgi:PLP dependent protein
MGFPGLGERVAAIRAEIAEAVRRGGRGQDVRLIAVTKTHGPDAVTAAFDAGITDVGENKVQEALGKQEALTTAGTMPPVR